MCYNENGDGMKNFIKLSFMIIILIIVYIFKNDISGFLLNNIIYRNDNKILSYNEYYLEYDYSYVQNTDNNKAKNYQDVLNNIYTVLNSGDNNYSFYCDYSECISDLRKLLDDNIEVTIINNYIHPYNSFTTINIDISSKGQVTLKTKKVYDEYEIQYINDYIKKFVDDNIKNTMSVEEKIRLFHDYIINNTEYDTDGIKRSYNAYNLITTGKSICGGYSDIMSIYLNYLGIQNYKITSTNHVWNLVKIDGKWYHLDLTWDDPIASDGKQYLLHNFFLIETNELLKLDSIEHNFDKDVYTEAK